jgi:adenine-specific DNA-methyltransferase
LRGRDIKKYSYDFADIYLIATFPSLKIDIDNYPSVKQHLLSFGYDRLKQTGDVGARKKSNNKWFETQDSIGYWEDFSKQKIVWAEIARTGNAFTLDKNNYMVSNTGYMLVAKENRDEKHIYDNLLAFLNSKAILFYLNIISTRLDETGWRWLRQYVEILPIPKLSEIQLLPINSEVQNQLSEVVSSGQIKIDAFVNEFYGFTKEEILFLNGLYQK